MGQLRWREINTRDAGVVNKVELHRLEILARIRVESREKRRPGAFRNAQ